MNLVVYFLLLFLLCAVIRMGYDLFPTLKETNECGAKGAAEGFDKVSQGLVMC